MDISFELQDDLNIRIDTQEYGYLKGVNEELTEYVKDYMHMPKFRSGVWSGKVSLFQRQYRSFPYGLLLKVVKYTKQEWPELTYSISQNVKNLFVGFEPNHNYDHFAFEPYDYQKLAIEQICRRSKGICQLPTACHQKGDKVLMYNGIFKNIEDIEIGEFVIGGDGKPKRVLNIHRGKDDLYEVKPKNNRKQITVTKNHLLHLAFTNEGGNSKKHFTVDNISVADYLNKSNTYKHISKLKYSENEIAFAPMPLNCGLSPYFIGLYLGDGHNDTCCITNTDSECIDAIYEESSRFGMIAKPKKNTISYSMIGSKNKRNIIFNEFDKLGITFKNKNGTKCANRYIPQIVFHQSVDYRKNVIAGLIDSDGSLHNGTYYEFSSKSKQLATDIKRLAISIGLVCTLSFKVINGVKYYRVNIMGNISKIPVRIDRKKITKKSNTNAYKSGFTIDYKGYDDFYGIEVEDSLYITNDGMITHNSGKSFVATCAIDQINRQYKGNKSLIIVPSTHLIDQFYGDLIDYNIDSSLIGRVSADYKEFDKKIVVSTWQSMKNQMFQMERFNTVFVDECLDENTSIKTKNGDVLIKDIKIGDIIISYNSDTNQFEEDIVCYVYINMDISSNEDMYELMFDNGYIIMITGNHKILTTNRGYVEAKYILDTDDIIYI